MLLVVAVCAKTKIVVVADENKRTIDRERARVNESERESAHGRARASVQLLLVEKLNMCL